MKTALPIFALLFTLSLHATNRYVSTTGSDANPGTFALPWATIQHAANTALPGDTVFIRGGTYAQQVWMNVSGTAGNWIVFQNYPSETAILDGGSTNTQTEMFVISGQNYLKVIGLHLQNAMGNYSSGIYLANGASHIQLIGNTIHDIHFSTDPNAPVTSSTNVNPIVVYNQNPTVACTDILIEGNEIYNCRTGFSEALTLSGNVDGFTVANNHVHDITNIGIDIAGGYGVSSDPATDAARNGTVRGNTVHHCVSGYAVSAGIYVDGGQNLVVEKNVSYANGRGFEVGCEEFGHVASNITVRNNWAYQNLEAGIGIGGYNYPATTGKVIDSEVLNNSFFQNNTTNIWDGELLVEYTENCTVRNNIFYATNTQNMLIVTRLGSTGLTLDYNNFYHPNGAAPAKVDWEGTVYTGFSNYQTGTGQDANSAFADPLYLSASPVDLHLAGNSPCINAGDPAFVPASDETDTDGETRLQHLRVDIGADEVACPTDLSLSGNLPPGTYPVSGVLTSDGSVAAGTNVVFQAAECLLAANFSVPVGAEFLVENVPCD